MREFRLEKDWSDWLYLKPGALWQIPRSWWFRPPTRQWRGIPDIMGCVAGHMIALELKLDHAPKDPKRESLQRYTLKKIRDAGSAIAIERVTPSSWPEVQRKLMYLSGTDALSL